MDEIVGVMQKNVGNGESVLQLPVTDKGHCTDNSYTLLPEGAAVPCQIIEQFPVLVQQPFAQQRIAGEVYQVPVVDAVRMGEVEVYALLPRNAMPEDFHQGKQCGQPNLVILAGNTFLQLLETDPAPTRFNLFPRDGHLDSQELIPLAILPRPGLEKAGKARHLSGVGVGHHLGKKDIRVTRYVLRLLF